MCAEHLCLSGLQNPCPTAVHMTLLHSSHQENDNNNTKCMWICVMWMWLWLWWLLSWSWSVLWLSCVFCGCYVSLVMCPLFRVQCGCLAIDHTSFCGFSSIDVVRSQDTYDFSIFLKLKKTTRNYPRYRKISNSPQHPVVAGFSMNQSVPGVPQEVAPVRLKCPVSFGVCKLTRAMMDRRMRHSLQVQSLRVVAVGT